MERIDNAFYREKQVQGWSREKKIALINAQVDNLHRLSICKNDSHYSYVAFDSYKTYWYVLYHHRFFRVILSILDLIQ